MIRFAQYCENGGISIAQIWNADRRKPIGTDWNPDSLVSAMFWFDRLRYVAA